MATVEQGAAFGKARCGGRGQTDVVAPTLQIVEAEQTGRFLADVLSRVVGLVGEHGLEIRLQAKSETFQFPQSRVMADARPAVERSYPSALGSLLHTDVYRSIVGIGKIFQYTDGLVIPHHLY